MANFPTNLDSFTTHAIGDVINPDFDNTQQEAIAALEAKVGVDSSAVTSSHDYKLSEVTSTDKSVGKTATQTLTNKTLTSPVVNVGSDATGDMYYRNAGVLTRIPIGTDNQIMKINGSTPNWEAETTTVNGSTTVAGIYEAGTSAEVTAGTATGGTGAVLVVTPDALAASTPVFDGSGLTTVSKITTAPGAVDVGTSSTAENTLLSYSLAGGILSTNNVVNVKAYLEITSSGTPSETITMRFKYGATTLFSPTYAVTTSNLTHKTKVDFTIMSAGTTGTQSSDLLLTIAASSPASTNTVLTATSSEDSTAAKTIAITGQSGASDANLHIILRDVVITRIK